MNKLKRFVAYFLYVLFIAYVFSWAEKYAMHLHRLGSATFNIYPSIGFRILYPIIIGILIGLPKVLAQLRKEGFWKWDWVKFLAIGIPAFFLGIYPLLVYLPHLSPPLPSELPVFFVMTYKSQVLIPFSGMVFGYLLASTPIKTNK